MSLAQSAQNGMQFMHNTNRRRRRDETVLSRRRRRCVLGFTERSPRLPVAPRVTYMYTVFHSLIYCELALAASVC